MSCRWPRVLMLLGCLLPYGPVGAQGLVVGCGEVAGEWTWLLGGTVEGCKNEPTRIVAPFEREGGTRPVDVTKVKKGSETWDMRVQTLVERKTVAEGCPLQSSATILSRRAEASAVR